MTISSFLFDLDGTLADSSAGFIRAFNRFLVAHGQLPADDQSISETISAGAATTISTLWQHPLSAEETEQLRLEFLAFYEEIGDSGSVAYPGISECLQQLKSAGADIGVVTNKIETLAMSVLEQTDLLKYVDCLVCGDQVSRRKPDPEGLLKAMNMLNARPENCLYAGDHSKDIETARQAGIRSLAVGFGFRPAKENFYDWPADWHAEQPAQFTDILLSQLSVRNPI